MEVSWLRVALSVGSVCCLSAVVDAGLQLYMTKSSGVSSTAKYKAVGYEGRGERRKREEFQILVKYIICYIWGFTLLSVSVSVASTDSIFRFWTVLGYICIFTWKYHFCFVAQFCIPSFC